VARVDRELAGNLELATLYDQTRQAAVMEIGEFGAVRGDLERELPAETFAFVANLYDGIVAVEAAMERRGPAGTIKDADRQLVEAWEGDAREAQRVLRAALLPPPAPSEPPVRPKRSLVARLRDALRGGSA